MSLLTGICAGLLAGSMLAPGPTSTQGSDPVREASEPSRPPSGSSRGSELLFQADQGNRSPDRSIPQSSDPSRPPSRSPDRTETGPASGLQYGLVIAGIGGEKKYVDRNLDWARGFRDVLTAEYGFSEDRLILLVEDAAAVGGPPAAKSTLAQIRRAVADLAALVRPVDDLFILLIGHGSATDGGARLNIPGPDLTADMLRDALGEVGGRYTVVVNGASASAPFIEALSGPGRVIVTATKSSGERLSTVFPEHLLAALEGEAGDLDRDGRVSVLESFVYAKNKTAEWYAGQGLLATEHPLLDDNGDGRGTREPGPGGTDGMLAGRVYFGRSQAAALTTGSPEEKALRAGMEELRWMIDELKSRKDRLDPEEYAARMEELLIELARATRQLRTLEEHPP